LRAFLSTSGSVEGEVVVSFEDREVLYDVAELDEVALAYATTVHKS
jgi:exodeoxyribonuclease V alpha subunit